MSGLAATVGWITVARTAACHIWPSHSTSRMEWGYHDRCNQQRCNERHRRDVIVGSGWTMGHYAVADLALPTSASIRTTSICSRCALSGSAISKFSLRRRARKGCKLALTERPDVILMDLEMPLLDRWEPVRRLKKDAQTGHIPIIGMSAHALDSEREQAIAAGCDGFDVKPIEFESLVAAIRRVVANPK